jgi:hypothetical protein
MLGHLQARLRDNAHLLLAFSLLTLASFGMASAETLVWTERSSGDLTTLSYGPLDPAKIPLFLLSCFNEMEVAVLDVHQEVAGAAPGDAITIELSSAKGQAPIEAEVAQNRETGTTFAEASDIRVRPILEVLRDKGPVTLAVGKQSTALSDAGREEAASQFSKACKLK